MPLATATVEFVPLRNGLANLPASLANMLFTANIAPQNAVVELETAPAAKKSRAPTRTVYMGFTGLPSAKDNTIEIDPSFASTLGLSHGQSVKISVNAQAPLAHKIHLQPVTSGDWEIVRTHGAYLETYAINQIRAVAVGQPITVFPSPTALANLMVVSVEPPSARVARVDPFAELTVAAKDSNGPGVSESAEALNEANATETKHACVISRVSASPYIENLQSRELLIRGLLPPAFKNGSRVAVTLALPVTLSAITANSGGSGGQGAGTGEEAEVQRARVVYATYELDPALSAVLGLSFGLSNALGLVGDEVIGAKVQVKTTAARFGAGIHATLRPYSLQTGSTKSSKSTQLTPEQIEALQLSFVGKGLVVPPMDSILPLGGIIDSDSREWGRPAKVTWGAETPLAESKRMKPLSAAAASASVKNGKQLPVQHPVVGQDELIDSLESAIMTGGGTLLYGSRGCGKSVIIRNVVSRLKQKHIRPVFFPCGTYTEKALPTVRDALRKVALEAQWTSPCVIVFDDIDKLIPAQQEHSNDSARQQQLAEVFHNTWARLITLGKVSVLASAQDQSEVNAFLLSSHLLDNVVHIKSPGKDLRESILRKAIETMGLESAKSLDLIEVVGETEGYQPGDLWILVERLSSMLALNQAQADLEISQDTKKVQGIAEDAPTSKVSSKESRKLVTTQALLDAAVGFTPASLRGVKLEKPNTKWDDVGGLTEAKRVVLETLEWPTKYAPIFANCPLRLRSGLLLYGYPGCGKTMLASAIANQTGLNFISVKGPEILNKYIGASEQSVRDLFDRAQAAKPCVLFFDEFDSIAPKRGHDATGVTDRVVNQLLTQMDGAEGLDGVYVLAATSRPDMIDSALLRPGRLDKSLLCGMPDENDRYDIMMRAARKLQLAPEVDLRGVAKKTSRFSGADLQALIYNAYLSAVHDVLNQQAAAAANARAKQAGFPGADPDNANNGFLLGKGDLEASKKYLGEGTDGLTRSAPNGTEDGGDGGDGVTSGSSQNVVIKLKDIEKALAESKSSISPKELARFQAIYAEFSTDRNGEMPPGVSSNEIGGRVTLQ